VHNRGHFPPEKGTVSFTKQHTDCEVLREISQPERR
jgi:hypothetical protein